MAQPRAVHHQAVQLRSATPQSQVVQRHGNREAFQLPANLSNFGGGGQPLPGAVQQKMESFFGTSFAEVRVHVGREASSIGALAFTQGSNLYFAQGQYNPHTPQGQQILGHELTHVVQQRAGRVRNPFGSGVAVVQDSVMEAEADRMGLRATSHNAPVQAKMVSPARLSGGIRAASRFSARPNTTVQRQPEIQEDGSYRDPNYPGLILDRDHEASDEYQSWFKVRENILNATNVSYEDRQYFNTDNETWYPKYHNNAQNCYICRRFDDIVNISDIAYQGIGNSQAYKVKELRKSISGGLLPAIDVRRKVGGGYTLVNGRNRIEVSLEAGYDKIPIIIVD